MIDIKKPTLLVDESKARENIRTMAEKARQNGIFLRPHFKTHQSADIGSWFLEEGVKKITASSVSMARYFADHGWTDITIAFPYNPLECNDINLIAEKATLNLLVESKEALHHLKDHVNDGVGYFIKVDVGTRRTGLQVNQKDILKQLVDQETTGHPFLGLLAHAGHSYRARSRKKILEIYQEGLDTLQEIRNVLGAKPFVSWGDTPTASVAEDLHQIDELRAGNFVFYDVMQSQIGSCGLSNIAVAMACPVVAKHENRDEAVIYGGGVHFSKDALTRTDGSNYFGEVVSFNESGWHLSGQAVLDRISQEHGIIKGASSFISKLKIGDVVGVLPVHSCLTADLMPGYFTFEGKVLNKLKKEL